jgi:hypothetical protein
MRMLLANLLIFNLRRFGIANAHSRAHEETPKPPEVYSFMQSIRRTVTLSVALGTLTLTGVQAWALPLAAIGTPGTAIQEPKPVPPTPTPDQTQPAPDQTQQDEAKSHTFMGTVVRDGEQFSLRDGFGSVFMLDDASKAQPFEGKQVKVTGRLDTEAKLIHVDAIEGVAA